MHRRAALEHHLENGFERQHARDRREGRVLADRVARKICTFDENIGLAELSDLRSRHNGHCHLRELRQMKHTVWMLELNSAGTQRLRVVSDHCQDRESERRTGVLVRPIPDLLRRCRSTSRRQSHALVLDALPGHRVGRLRW